jgi:hypothetical protein
MNALQPALSTFNSGDQMLGARLSIGSSGAERRRYARMNTTLNGKIFADYQCSDCKVVDLACNGARIRPQDLFVPPTVSLQIPGIGTVSARVVWRRKGQIGLEFRKTPERLMNAIMAFMQRFHQPLPA